MADVDVENSLDQKKTPKPNKLIGMRHIQFFMLFMCLIFAYGMRTNMSVGIIAMMDDNPPDSSIPTFPDWTEKDTILSSFFWGYVIPQIGAGQLVKRSGPKWFLAAAMFVNALFAALTPVMAINVGQAGVIVCRVIQGLSQGFIYPSVHTLLGKWTPLDERSKIGSFVYTGGPLGTAFSMPITGYISGSTIGWPTAFYLYGGLGIGWAIVWALLGADSPAKHQRISEEEKKYIETNSGSDSETEIPTPWKSIFTSVPFFAIFIAHCGQNWGFWTLLTEIPSYMANIMNYDISENSLLSALPYFVLWILSYIFSPIADFLIVRKLLSLGNVRKLFQSIGVLIPAVALLWLSFIDSSQKTLALVLLVIAVGFNAATYSGYLVNIIDIAPNFSGTLMGLSNGPSNIFSIIAPLTLKMIGKDETDPELWKMVFCIAAGIWFVTNMVYIVLGTGEVQPWNEGEPQTKKTNSENEDKTE